MKKKLNATLQKACALLLALVMVLGHIPGSVLPARAEEAAHNDLAVKVADPATVNAWKDHFPANSTEYAGGVWTDKSVFESADAYLAATAENDDAHKEALALSNSDNFLVSLSAIASNKSIHGYENLPSDTMLVLDLSGSMSHENMRAMINATNRAITRLLELNKHNRVGVVLYSGDHGFNASQADTATVILPLDRYTTTAMGNGSPAYLTYTGSGNADGTVAIATGFFGQVEVKDSNGNTLTYVNKSAQGGTYIQNGLYQAMMQLTDPNNDPEIESGIQAGTTRIPIMVLMSDGAPSAATTDYDGDEDGFVTSNIGNGGSNTNDMAFLTQLTAVYAKYKIEQKYQASDPEMKLRFYTLGLGVVNNDLAESVLDPAIDDYNSRWNSFERTATGSSFGIDSWDMKPRSVTVGDKGFVREDDSHRDYVDEYFPASDTAGLTAAFEDIVEEIILQSAYYPTHVEDDDFNQGGFLEFRDYIGENMEVKAVKGVALGDHLYTGEMFASQLTNMGTPEFPEDLGNQLVWALIDRLQIEPEGGKTAVVRAQELLDHAWKAGQLAYNVDAGGKVSYSNYVGWYADAEGKYLGFWDGKEPFTDAPETAVQAVKSYAVMGKVDNDEDHRDTDMLYASIQVRTNIATGEQIVYGKLPASLIPLIKYNVELGQNVTNPMATGATATMTYTPAAPSRLLYEVGLDSRIDLLDIAGTAPDQDALNKYKTADGKYAFYTNQWQHEENADPKTEHNTFVAFQPSEENERYVYHEDTVVYRSTNSPYTDSTQRPTSGVTAKVVYTTDGSGIEIDWETIPAAVFANPNNLVYKDGRWIVKKGTIRLYDARTAVSKDPNATGTLDHSEHPQVHLPDATNEHYHLDAVLGNNGKLTIDAPEGIKITKALSGSLTNKGPYQFEVAAAGVTSATLIKEVNGVRSTSVLTFSNGTATFELNAGEIAWIVGIPVGTEVTVGEVDEVGNAFEVATINGENKTKFRTTIVSGQIVSAAFVNSEETKGQLTVSKLVDSSIESHKRESSFAFQIEISGGAIKADQSYTAQMQDGSTLDLTVVKGEDDKLYLKNGESNITLRHQQSLTILGLPDETTVTVTEVDLPNGFTAQQATQTTTVNKGDSDVLTFTNNYHAAPTDAPTNISITGTKTLQSDEHEWSGVFKFELQKLVEGEWEKVNSAAQVGGTHYESNGEATVEFENAVNETARTFVLSLDGEIYEAAGTYSYRIVEKNDSQPGVIYDVRNCYFDVVVTDDGTGKLKISDVVKGADTDVKQTSDPEGWNVSAAFTNQYVVEGSAEAIIGIQKFIKSDYGVVIPPAGFQFALYEADEDYKIKPEGNTYTSATTSSAGLANIGMTYEESGTHYYVLKEIVPENKIDGVTYSNEEYRVKIVVGHDGGKYTIALTVYDVDGNIIVSDDTPADTATSDNVVVAQVEGVQFTNKYTPDPVQLVIPISGTKVLTGREIKQSDAFVIDGYGADENFKITTDKLGEGEVTYNSVTNAWTFTMDPLGYDTVGTYYYVIKEQLPTDLNGNSITVKDGVTYDTTEYHVTVTVTGDNSTGALTARVTSIAKAGNEGGVTAIVFNNKYDAEPVGVNLSATKNLHGTLKLAKDMFKFDLFQLTEEKGQTVETKIETVGNSENITEVTAQDGEVYTTAPVKFSELTYSAAGVYKYKIVEQNGMRSGMTYSDAVYYALVNVEDPGNGKMTATVKYYSDSSFSNELSKDPVFVNRYAAVASASINININKVLETVYGDKLNAADIEYSFGLYATDLHFENESGTATATSIKNSNGTYTITTPSYTSGGGYRYVLKEIAGADTSTTYDRTVYYVLVDVQDVDGRLVANATVGTTHNGPTLTGVLSADTNPTFVNKKQVSASEKIAIPVAKQVIGNYTWNSETEFTFDLYEATVDADIWTIGDKIVSENVTASTAVGEDGLKSVSLGELTYNEAGDYYYVVKETAGELSGIVYDTAEFHVTVRVAPDETDATKLKAEVAEIYKVTTVNGQTSSETADKVLFQNEYVVDGEVHATINGTKKLTGRAMKNGEFTFELYKAAVNNGIWTTVGEPVTTTNTVKEGDTSEGYFHFHGGEYLTFDEDDQTDHFFIVKEKYGDETKNGVTYDGTEYHVKITVTHDGLGRLETPDVEVMNPKTGQTGLVFENSYTPTASADFGFSVDGTKSLIGGVLKDGAFTFELYKAKSDGTADGSALATATNKDGKFTLSHIFAKEGLTDIQAGDKLHYIVKEQIPGDAETVDGKPQKDGTIYDTKEYHITVTIHQSDDKLYAEVEKDGIVMKKGDTLDFTNTYAPSSTPTEDPNKPSSPSTGDEGIFHWIVLMAISGVGLLLTLIGSLTRKRQRR